MSKHNFMVVTAALLSALSPACGDNGGHKSVAASDLIAQTAKTTCANAPSCPSDAVNGFYLLGATDVDQCTQVLTRFLEDAPDLKKTLAAVNAGRVKYDGQKAAQCLAQKISFCKSEVNIVDAMSLDRDACDGAFVGTIAEGQSCNVDEECVPGLYCQGANSGTCGKCAKRGTKGSACDTRASSSDACVPAADAQGATCVAKKTGDAKSYCFDAYLQPAANEGASCGVVYADDFTVKDTPCALGLYCAPDGTCQKALSQGAKCVDGTTCAVGSWCRESNDGSSYCTAIPLRDNEGEACASGDQANYDVGVCNPHLRLSCVDGKCAKLAGDGSQGNACAADLPTFGALFCKVGLRCHLDTKTCQPAKPAAQACTQDAECESDNCAGELGAKTCQPPLMCI